MMNIRHVVVCWWLLLGATTLFVSTLLADIRYAQNFSIEEIGQGLCQVTVRQPLLNKKEPFRYLLVSSGTEIPQGISPQTQIVHVPVKRVVAMSTTYLAGIDELGEAKSVVAVSLHKHPNTPSIRKRIEEGLIEEVGSGASKNIELILTLEPDIVFTNVIGMPEYDIQEDLQRIGIAAGLTASWTESSLLGRAEWIKFFGAFYNKQDEAERYFNHIEKVYQELCGQVAEVPNRPTVLVNAPNGNTWFISGGNSYVSRAIHDAGASFIWADNDTVGSTPRDFEEVYARALESDIWLNPGQFKKLSDLLASDERFVDFRAAQRGMVYNNNKRLNDFGGNDFWERGSVHPEEILADLIAIFHPEVLPSHEFVFYQKLVD